MRLTSFLQVLLRRRFPKSSFRRPMEGRNRGRQKPVTLWSLSLGELDEEETVNGQTVPVRSKVPIIMVPDLKDFKLKPYVTYRAEKVHEPPLEARDFFNMFYAPEIEAKEKNLTLENVPSDSDNEEKTRSSFFQKVMSNKSKAD
uniref:39S ribosomal protein L41-B, mitochondrial-like n=1 Tax=Phallusia mammillata TaxID=59560 RepID=A0A6F9DLW5_9ASCI|nr:39S ribosomal protein L41-B, mitochondrial-like [Phallusia mammillata]